MQEKMICPICGKEYTERPALSRLDNETEICPDCGMAQALKAWEDAKSIIYDTSKQPRRKFTPTKGKIYKNDNGSKYKCLSVDPDADTAVMINVESGWMFTAHGLGQYRDGSIDWMFSAGGRFEYDIG